MIGDDGEMVFDMAWARSAASCSVALNFCAAVINAPIAQRRTALLQGAAQRVSHLKPAIAVLHDTRWWQTRIEAALHAAANGADR